MKLKLKTLAAVAALALGGQAQAALSDFVVDNGTLMLTVWNSAGTQSYVRDLGVTLNDFLGGTTTGVQFAGDSLFTSTFSGVAGANLRWNIVAADQIEDDGNGARIVSTYANPGIQQFANVKGVADQAVGWAGTQNGNGCDTSVSCNSIGTGPTYGGDATWGADYGGQAGAANSLGTGFGSVNFYSLIGGAVATTELATVSLLGVFGLSSDGTTTFTSNAPAPVPLPAAAWMLAAGLMGLGGAIRRRRAAAE